jgi:hypothetical protein
MSFSSKLTTLRTVASALRALAEELSNPDSQLTVMEYFQMEDVLAKVVDLNKVLDEKKLVLELEEDEEGSILGYSLVIAGKSDRRPALTDVEIEALGVYPSTRLAAEWELIPFSFDRRTARETS